MPALFSFRISSTVIPANLCPPLAMATVTYLANSSGLLPPAAHRKSSMNLLKYSSSSLVLADAKRWTSARLRLGHLMEDLLASPAWMAFFEWVQSNPGQATYKSAVAPAKSIDDCIEREYAKGTLKGIELTLAAPAMIVAEMKSILEDEERQEDGRSNDDDNADNGDD